jgi:hypothetical protein
MKETQSLAIFLRSSPQTRNMVDQLPKNRIPRTNITPSFRLFFQLSSLLTISSVSTYKKMAETPMFWHFLFFQILYHFHQKTRSCDA